VSKTETQIFVKLTLSPL